MNFSSCRGRRSGKLTRFEMNFSSCRGRRSGKLCNSSEVRKKKDRPPLREKEIQGENSGNFLSFTPL